VDESKAMSKNDLDSMLSDERELKDLLSKKQTELAEKRRLLAPHQSDKVLLKIEDFASLFVPGGIVWESFEDILENLKLLAELDPKAIGKLTNEKLYARGPAVKYIIENLLAGVLVPRSDLWTVLEHIAKSRKVDGCPFVPQAGE